MLHVDPLMLNLFTASKHGASALPAVLPMGLGTAATWQASKPTPVCRRALGRKAHGDGRPSHYHGS